MRPKALQRKHALVGADPVSSGRKVPAPGEDPSADIRRILELLEQIEARLSLAANLKSDGSGEEGQEVMTRSRSARPKSI